ncbi:MAG: hypothetical protein ACRD43_00640 [Pyrinomonadaceae bacterium]
MTSIKIPVLATFICILAFAAAAAISAASVSTGGNVASLDLKPGRCLLEIDGRKYISGPCRIEMDKDGSFRIYENRQKGYFAYVTIVPGGAEGYWNETRQSTHAHSSLGSLARDGACWTNDHAKVCAWR